MKCEQYVRVNHSSPAPPSCPNMLTSTSTKQGDNGQNNRLEATKQKFTNLWVTSCDEAVTENQLACDILQFFNVNRSKPKIMMLLMLPTSIACVADANILYLIPLLSQDY